jgi:DNA-binding Xre family transcriptional regulator
MRVPLRVRIPELLERRKLTPYELSKRSGGRISMSTAYRLNRNRGRAHTFDSELLEQLCAALDVGPGELLERDSKRRGR